MTELKRRCRRYRASGIISLENPYWRSEGQIHHIDLKVVRWVCFEIYNIVAASDALAGGFEFADEEEGPGNSSLVKLHHELAESRLSEQLLQLCMLVRTYDAMMSQSENSEKCAEHVKETSGENFIGDLDGESLSLREACNKVIHAIEVRPIYEDVEYSGGGEGKE